LDQTDPKVLVAAATGAGKSLLGGIVSRRLVRERGCQLVILVAPSIHLKLQWLETLAACGFKVKDASNESVRLAVETGELADYDAIVMTYQQLQSDAELWVTVARQVKTLLIPDEIHHAAVNQAFGEALDMLSEASCWRVAFSATPFTTSGKRLAVIDMDFKDGKWIAVTLPGAEYSYGDAINDRDKVCRRVEFHWVHGEATTTFRSISDPEVTKTRYVCLDDEKISDRLPADMLDPDGKIATECLKEGLRYLTEFKELYRRSAMMVRAKSKEHGGRVAERLRWLVRNNPKWSFYKIELVYHDSPGAHERIAQFNNDDTDIIVAIDMIAEGIDIPRLRVGVWLTNILTRMAFRQTVGRFCRWEKQLDQILMLEFGKDNAQATQFAKIVAPAHVLLKGYGAEIEKMITEALERQTKEPGPGPGPDPMWERIDGSSQTTGESRTWAGQTETEVDLLALFDRAAPPERRGLLNSVLSDVEKIAMARGMRGESRAGPPPSHDDEVPHHRRFEQEREENKRLVDAIVGRIRRSMTRDLSQIEKNDLYSRINTAANRHADLRNGVTDVAPLEKLVKRRKYLHMLLGDVIAGRRGFADI